MGERLVRAFVAQHRRHVARHFGQRLDQLGLELGADGPARLARGDGETGEHRELAGEGLGRGDADLGSGKRRQHGIGFARDRRFAHIDDGEDVLALGAAITQRSPSVSAVSPDCETNSAAPSGSSAVSR